MSTTPRTYAAQYGPQSPYAQYREEEAYDFARQLETELTACTTRLAEVEKELAFEREIHKKEGEIVAKVFKDFNTSQARLAKVEGERDEAQHQIEALCNLNCNIADTLRSRGFTAPQPLDERVIAMAQERDTLAADNARLREARVHIGKVYACSCGPEWTSYGGNHHDPNCKAEVLEEFDAALEPTAKPSPVPASGNEHSMNIRPCDICGKTKPVNLRQTFLICDDCHAVRASENASPELIQGQHWEQYLAWQFPATTGCIPLHDWIKQRVMDSNIVRSVVKRCEAQSNTLVQLVTDRDELKRRVEELEKAYISKESELGVTAARLVVSTERIGQLGKQIASVDSLRAELTTLKETVTKLKIERDGALHSSESWELLHAKRHEEVERLKAEIVRKDTDTKMLDWLESKFGRWHQGSVLSLMDDKWYCNSGFHEGTTARKAIEAAMLAALSRTAPKEGGKV